MDDEIQDRFRRKIKGLLGIDLPDGYRAERRMRRNGTIEFFYYFGKKRFRSLIEVCKHLVPTYVKKSKKHKTTSKKVLI